jgi:hypothetical protein
VIGTTQVKITFVGLVLTAPAMMCEGIPLR